MAKPLSPKSWDNPPFLVHMVSPAELFESAQRLRGQDPSHAAELLRKAVSAYASLGDDIGRGQCLVELSRLMSTAGDVQQARRLARQAIDLLRHEPAHHGQAHLWAADLALAQDDESAAAAHFLLAQELLEGKARFRVFQGLGQLAFDHGDLDLAERHYMEAWRFASELAPCEAALLRERFADLALARGREGECRAQLEAALAHVAGVPGCGDLSARLRTELADLLACAGQVKRAAQLYEQVIGYYEQKGRRQRADRARRRRDGLRWNKTSLGS